MYSHQRCQSDGLCTNNRQYVEISTSPKLRAAREKALQHSLDIMYLSILKQDLIRIRSWRMWLGDHISKEQSRMGVRFSENARDLGSL